MAHNDTAKKKTYLWLIVVLAFGLTILFWKHSDKIESSVKPIVPIEQQAKRSATVSETKAVMNAEHPAPAQAEGHAAPADTAHTAPASAH